MQEDLNRKFTVFWRFSKSLDCSSTFSCSREIPSSGRETMNETIKIALGSVIAAYFLIFVLLLFFSGLISRCLWCFRITTLSHIHLPLHLLGAQTFQAEKCRVMAHQGSQKYCRQARDNKTNNFSFSHYLERFFAMIKLACVAREAKRG